MSNCNYCKGEPEPGFIETDNNGPIVPCPICNNTQPGDAASACPSENFLQFSLNQSPPKSNQSEGA